MATAVFREGRQVGKNEPRAGISLRKKHRFFMKNRPKNEVPQLPPEAQNGSQERPRRGPKKAQGRPSIRHKRTQEQRSQGKKIQVETRQQKTRPEARRDNKLTKGLFRSTKAVSTSPVANLLLVHLMHGSTLINKYGFWEGSGLRRPRAHPGARPGPPGDHPGATQSRAT